MAEVTESQESNPPSNDIRLIEVDASERADIDPQDLYQNTIKGYRLNKLTLKNRGNSMFKS